MLESYSLTGAFLTLGASLVIAVAVWAAYRAAMHDTSVRYRTFWPRLWAQSVDACVLWPLTLIPAVAYSVGGSYALATALSGLGSIGYFVYAVILHGRCGQTVGKRVTKVRVVDMKTGGRLTWRQAVVREAIPLAMSVFLLVAALLNPQEPSTTAVGGLRSSPSFLVWLLATLPLLWFATEMVTMLANQYRRSLHDFIAGTIVERTSIKT